MDLERGKPMRENAIFRIYSMTKPITAVALMMLAEEGLIGLDDDVATHIPGVEEPGGLRHRRAEPAADVGRRAFLTTPVARPMKVVDLVTHTSGLTYGFMNRTNVDARLSPCAASPSSRRRRRSRRHDRPACRHCRWSSRRARPGTTRSRST